MSDLFVDDATSSTSADPESYDLVTKVNKCLEQCKSHQSVWRKDAEEDFAFVAGDQWSVEDREKLNEQLRPMLTFNRVTPIIDSVAGTEVQNRQEVRYQPREPGDVGVNELLTGAAEWVRDQCDAEDEESDAFWDCLVCGLGVTETRLDYEVEPEGKILIDRIDPLEMYWDPASRKRNLDDARYVLRVRRIDEEDFEALWPGMKDELGSGAIAEGDETASPDMHVVDPRTWYSDDKARPDGLDQRGKYRVVEYQWFEREVYWKLADPTTGQLAELTDDQYQTLVPRMRKMGMMLDGVRMTKRVYMRAFICAGTELEKGKSPCDNGFTYKFITGKRDRNAGVWYGLVRPMKDPQRWANKWLSQILHIINANAKGGVMAESDAVKNVRAFEQDWSKPDAVTYVNPGALSNNKIQPKPIGAFPAQIGQLMEFAIGSVRDVSGVSLEMLGQASRQQAGVLEYQRKQAALTILGTLFDSLRRYRKEQGRCLLYMIMTYISDGRLVRIAGEDGTAKYVPLVHRPGTAEYDVVVDDAPSSPNQKERTWQILQGLLPEVMKMGVPMQAWVEILKASPLPSGFTDKLVSVMQEQANQPKGPSPEEQKMLVDQQAAAASLQLEQVKTKQQIELERQKAMADQQLEREKAEAEFALEQQKAANAERLAREDMERKNALATAAAANEMNLKAGFAADGEDPRAGTKALNDKLGQLVEVMTGIGAKLVESQKQVVEGMDRIAVGQERVERAALAETEVVIGPDGKKRGRKVAPR